MDAAASLKDAPQWDEKTVLGDTQTEWVELISNLPDEQAALLSNLVEQHKQGFVDIVYSRLMHNQDVAVFLSHQSVHDRLEHSLSKWLVHLLESRPDDVVAFVQEQCQMGKLHARIQVPIHVILQGARLFKNEIIKKLQTNIAERDTLVRLIVHISNAVDIAIEIMTETFVGDSRKSAQTDEAYRTFALSHDIPLERESQRAALMEWSQSILFNLYGNDNAPLMPLGNSDFGLWMQHKADMMFSGSVTLERLRQSVRVIDDELLPAIKSARKNNPAELSASLSHFQIKISEVKFLVSELFQVAATMESGRDPLTRALNRKFMPSILTREVRMALQKGLDFSVLMIDIDHFKMINDKLGHSGGDKVLQQVAENVLSLCRPGDFVFRYGGEEFLVALVETGKHDALDLAENMRQRIGQLHLRLPTDLSSAVTLSIGVASFDGDPDYAQLVERADQALYRAKRSGRNRCEVDNMTGFPVTEAF